jgi:hypothetical protein
VKPTLNSELNAQKDFVEELNVLSDKLDQENELMLRILKAKAVEVKEKEVEKVCKRVNHVVLDGHIN